MTAPLSSSPESAAPAASDRAAPAYQVVARRYRPQSFAELVGQQVVSTALANAIQQNRVGHAYLFTGARGTGKTSTARIFAKCLNCVQGPTLTPCQQCDNCQGITAGDDIDVLEIDGASNRRIEEIRQLRSTVSIRPSRARYKIYIIDEVHMLTREAFNALLKTLEEPPPHVKFLFCTTEPEKIPITIRSRCQQFDFVPVDEAAICERLRSIAASEQVQIDEDAVRMLARRAAGSMRDSQSLLEQILSTGHREISLAAAQQLLGIANHEQIEQIAERIEAADAPGAIAAAHSALQGGVDPAQLTSQLLDYVRDCLLAAVGCTEAQWSAVAAGEVARIRRIAESFGTERLLAIAQILDDTLSKMRHSTHPKILVEIALVRVCHLGNFRLVSDLIERLSTTGAGSGSRAAQASPAPPQAGRPVAASPPAPRGGPAAPPPAVPHSPASPLSAAAAPAAAAAKKKEIVSPPDGEANPVAPQTASRIELTAANVAELWQAALQQLNDTTADMVAQCQALEVVSPTHLVVRLPEHLRKLCVRPDRVQRISAALHSVCGVPCQIEFLAATAESAAAAPKPTLSRAQQRRDMERQPLVQRAIDLFDGEVLEVWQSKPQ